MVNNARDLEQLLKDQLAETKVENLMNELQLDQEPIEEQFENRYNEAYAKLDK